MRIDPELIRTLQTVDACSSVAGAAEQLHVTQSAISARLRRLGEIVGGAVVAPAGRGIEVTAHGSFVLTSAISLVHAHDEAVRRLAGADERTVVKVLANEMFFSTEVLGVAALLRRRHPMVTIKWTVDAAAHKSSRFPPDHFDLAVHKILERDLQPSDLVAWTDSLEWIQSVDHFFDRGEPVPIITFGSDCFYRPVIEETLRRSGRKYDIVVSCPSLAGVIEAVRAGLGVAVISGRNRHLQVRRWIEADEHPSLPPVVQICRKHPDAPPVVDEIAHLLASATS